jgi:outer membrane PBP1 activator LpoA protein
MTFARSQIACALAAILGAAVFAGCGNDVPSGSVAKVGDETIDKAEFDKWLKSAASGAGAG